jgi:hypothetical protein
MSLEDPPSIKNISEMYVSGVNTFIKVGYNVVYLGVSAPSIRRE